jgi:hypothetical protein
LSVERMKMKRRFLSSSALDRQHLLGLPRMALS